MKAKYAIYLLAPLLFAGVFILALGPVSANDPSQLPPKENSDLITNLIASTDVSSDIATIFATPLEDSSGAVFLGMPNDANLCSNITDDQLYLRIPLSLTPLSAHAEELEGETWVAGFDSDSDGVIDFYARIKDGLLEVVFNVVEGDLNEVMDAIADSYQNSSGNAPEAQAQSDDTATPSALSGANCLSWDPHREKRNRIFIDLNTPEGSAPDSQRRAIDGLNYTYNIQSENHIIGGMGLDPSHDATVIEAEIGAKYPAKRSEVSKVILNGLCIPIENQAGKTTRKDGSAFAYFNDQKDPKFQALFPEEDFLPENDEPSNLDFIRNVMYTMKWNLFLDGTRPPEIYAKPFDNILIEEAVKVYSLAHAVYVTGGSYFPEDPGNEYWRPYYEYARTSANLPETLSNENRVGAYATRGEMMEALVGSMVKSPGLYTPQAKQEIIQYLETGQLPAETE